MDILSIDPGRTTGIAVKIADNYHTCTLTDRRDIISLIKSHRWAVVIYERFISSGAISSHGIFTIELVGAIESTCEDQGLNIAPRTSIQRKTFIEAAKDKASSNISHEIDAMAHLLAWEAINAAS